MRIGTRGSALALRQSELIATSLRTLYPDLTLDVMVVRTEGDAIQDRPIAQFGDKGVFVRALEQSLLDRTIDLAVHSLKDVPTDREHPDLQLAGFSAREDPRDALVSRTGLSLASLPPHARVGTASLRRRVQLRTVRPDCRALGIRGNVDTRLKSLLSGEYDAIILAAAGLHRLGLQQRITEYLAVASFVPDAGQAIIALQCRRDDPAVEIAQAVSNPISWMVGTAERSAVRAMGAGCLSPVGVHAVLEGNALLLRGMAATEDGGRLVRHEMSGPASSPAAFGADFGNQLIRRLGA